MGVRDLSHGLHLEGDARFARGVGIDGSYEKIALYRCDDTRAASFFERVVRGGAGVRT